MIYHACYFWHLEWYSTLVSGLSEKDGKLMNEVFTLCAQRKASKESKSIEKQGGKFISY